MAGPLAKPGYVSAHVGVAGGSPWPGQSGRRGGCGAAIAILPVLGNETDENAGLVLRREARGWGQGIWSCCWGQGEEKEILQDESVDGMRGEEHPYYGERKREEGGGVPRVVVRG